VARATVAEYRRAIARQTRVPATAATVEPAAADPAIADPAAAAEAPC
jgi:hypothetical protein